MHSTSLLLYTFATSFCIALNILVIVVPLIALTLGFTPFQIGLIVAVPGMMQILSRFPGGMLADRFGERRVMLGSAVAILMSSLIFWGVQAFGAILVAQGLIGLARSFFYDSCQSYASRWRPKEANRTLGFYISSVNLGNVSGFVLGGVMAASFGYGWAFGMAVLFAAGSLIVVARMQELSQRPVTRFRQYIVPMLRARPLYLAGIAAFVAASPVILMGSFYPVYFRHLGYSDGMVGLLASMHSIGTILSGFTYRAFERRLSKSVLFAGSISGVGLLMAFSVLFTSAWSLAAWLILLGTFSGYTNILYLQMTTEHSPPEQRGIGMAISGQFWSLANFAVPFAFGILVGLTDIREAFWWGGAAVLSIGLMTPLLFALLLNRYPGMLHSSS